MEELLPHYERELALLREQSQEFASRYPRVAGALHLRGDTAQDPHVERMIESFALLAARIHKRLDDDFPLFTESLLEVLYPHYLRPFPSCSIAQLDAGGALQSRAVTVPRHTELASRPIKGVPCQFRTSQDVVLLPIHLSSVSYRQALAAPAGTRLPKDATSCISFVLERSSPQAAWSCLKDQPVRIHLDGEPSQVSALREALCRKAVRIMVQVGEHEPWQEARDEAGAPLLPRLVGFDDDQSLIDLDARSHPAYRLLTEYFAFPEKFNFIDLPIRLPAALWRLDSDDLQAQSRQPQRISVHVLLTGIRSDSDESRQLEAVHQRNVLLGCTPVVNLFPQAADPIRLTHQDVAYPVVVDGRRAHAYEVHAIKRVYRLQQTAQGESVQEVRPFFSVRHHEGLDDEDWLTVDERGPLAGRGRREAGVYWAASRDSALAAASPGYELSLTLVDVDMAPAMPKAETLSLDVMATNRDLPTMLPIGVAGGDLFMPGGGVAKEIRLLRRPSAPLRLARGTGVLWRLISHLSINHLSLSASGIDGLKETLRLYDFGRHSANQRQVDGLVAVDYRPKVAWLPGEPYATFVRGTEVCLTVDEDSFVGTGLGLFAMVLDRFYGLAAHLNSFSQLTVLSSRTQEVLFSCPPRNGDLTLL